MTPEQAAALAPGTPVWVAEFSIEHTPGLWHVERGEFISVELRAFGDPIVGVYYPEADSPRHRFSAYVPFVFATRLDALRWVAGQLAGHRRAIDEAAERLSGEIVGELAAQHADGPDAAGPPACPHPTGSRISGGYDGKVIPRYPLRYGSAEVEACGACGAFRFPKFGKGDEWHDGPYMEVIEEARRRAKEDDEC